MLGVIFFPIYFCCCCCYLRFFFIFIVGCCHRQQICGFPFGNVQLVACMSHAGFSQLKTKWVNRNHDRLKCWKADISGTVVISSKLVSLPQPPSLYLLVQSSNRNTRKRSEIVNNKSTRTTSVTSFRSVLLFSFAIFLLILNVIVAIVVVSLFFIYFHPKSVIRVSYKLVPFVYFLFFFGLCSTWNCHRSPYVHQLLM